MGTISLLESSFMAALWPRGLKADGVIAGTASSLVEEIVACYSSLREKH